MRLAILLLGLVAAASSQDVCLSAEREPYLLFGTETDYNFANKRISTPRPQDVPGCEAQAIWLLNRHGTHNPDASEVAGLERLNQLKNTVIGNYNQRSPEPKICPADIEELKRWSWTPGHRGNDTVEHLPTRAYMQTQQLGRNWIDRYPRLFTPNQYDYHFNYGNDSVSLESFRAFTDGLFRSQAESMGLPQTRDVKLAAPFKYCPRWTRDVEENNDTLKEVRIFESQQEFGEMIANVSHRLGFSHNLDQSIIKDVYQMCRYNKAWDINHISPWCSVFSKSDLKLLEYAEDLETFSKYGHGDNADLSAAVACPHLKSMLDFLQKHAENDQPQQPRVSIQFVDAPALMSFITALGERKDASPLKGTNFHLGSTRDRQWSTSSMAPNNANLAAVLYKCNLSGNSFAKERYQVLFLENEQPMVVRGCHAGLCPWSNVKTRYSPAAESCKDVCDGATSLNSIVALSIGLIAFFFRFL